jgi:ataxin-10
VSRNFVQIASQKNVEENQKEIFNELLLECVKYLKVMCTKGPSFQNLIIKTTGMLESLKEVTAGKLANISKTIDLKCFQLIANLCVQNKLSQAKVWDSMSDVVLAKFETDDNCFVNVAAMIIYNIILSKASDVDHKQIVNISLRHYSNFMKDPTNPLPDFLHILMDFIICDNEDVLSIYQELQPEDQKTFLYYINDHLEDESSRIISASLLQHLIFEFKQKSDCILKTVSTYVDSIDPDIVVILLDIISTATTQEKYMKTLREDRSLFLNLGCLLQALHKIGKNSESIFNPIQKLEALAMTSDYNADFEKEFSYAMKTKLVKSLANLSHRNKKNQELAREMEIMLSIFECTNADARNPLIKEWSILAIRNLCEDNLENQEMVKNLTKVGDAANPLLKEMGLESGMLRIGKE